jgi:WD40 repeat protein/tetratricopeptide (TPR) repeat protein
MLFDLRDFKQAQVELKNSLENKLSAIEQQLAAQNQRLIDAASPDELSQILQQKQGLIEQQTIVNQAMTDVRSVYAEFSQFCEQFANWRLLLESQVEVVIAALSNLQYVVEKIDRNVEMILAEVRELAARIDVSAKIRARDEFSVYNPATENQIRQTIHQFKNLAHYLDYPVAAMQVGSIAASLGDLKEAESLLFEIFESSKNNHDKALAAYNLFFVYLRQGSNDKALKFLNQAIRLNRQAHILHNVDRYPIKSLLGAGGMGCVFLCEDTLEQRLVTVKCLWEIQSSGEAGEIFAEPLAMAKIAGDFVPKPLDYGYVDAAQRERAFFVTEFVEGAIDGEAWLAKYGQMDLATGAAVGIQVAQALQKAHEKGILHLDLKPANLLLKSSDSGIVVKIIDFGLAKIATSLRQVADSRQRQSARSQLAQQVFGTFDYAPPEQWGDTEYRFVSAKSDVFALGKTLYRFFSGKRPQHNIRQKYLPKAEGLLDLLEDCVEDDPEERPDIATLKEGLVGLLPKSTRIEKPKPIAPKIEQLSLQIGHSSSVESVAFSPDGKTALSGSQDCTVKWWDLESGRVIKSLEAHSSYVWSVAFSPDGKTALSGSWDSTVKWWDLSSCRVIKSLEAHSSVVLSVAFSPDGKTALSGSGDHTVKWWDLESGRVIKSLVEAHSLPVWFVAFSPDGKTALSGSGDNTVKWWELESGRVIKSLEAHSSDVKSVAFSPDGKTALSGSEDNTVKCWDLESGRVIKSLEAHSSDVKSVAFSPDGKTALSDSVDNTVKWWELESGRVIKSLKAHSCYVTSVAFSPDGKTALSDSVDNTVKWWELESGRVIKSLKAHSCYVTSVAFSPDGKTALSGSGDDTVKWWDLESGRVIKSLEAQFPCVESVAFSPDGKTALSGSWDNLVKLWDLESGRVIKSLEAHSEPVWSVAFSPDGKTALSGSWDNTMKLWDLESGRVIKSLEAHSNEVESVAFSPEGKTALSGSGDNTVKWWDLESGHVIKSLEAHSNSVESVAFSPDGKTALSGSGDNTVKWWDLESGRVIKSLEAHSSSVYSVAFSPDGKTALSGSWDNTVKWWDLESGHVIKSLEAHSSYVKSVAFSPDGKTALSGSQDTTIRLWNLETGE